MAVSEDTVIETKHTPGPWLNTYFCKPDGEPILTVQDVADTIAGSAHHSERAELFGVSLDDAKSDPDGRATVVCYTGNGPNAHNNARLIAAAPELLEALRALNHACRTADAREELPDEVDGSLLDAAAAAIAKAEGAA